MSKAELQAKPGLTWKLEPAKPNAKPWLSWLPRLYRKTTTKGKEEDGGDEASPSSGAEGG